MPQASSGLFPEVEQRLREAKGQEPSLGSLQPHCDLIGMMVRIVINIPI